jgi:foldase protein PrsA
MNQSPSAVECRGGMKMTAFKNRSPDSKKELLDVHLMIQQIRRRLAERAVLLGASMVIVVAGIVAGFGLSKAWNLEPEIVARVNGEPVTRGELQRMLEDPAVGRQLQQELGVQKPDSEALNRQALRKLITRRLILQEAGRRNFRVTEQDLEQAVAALRRGFKDLKSFAAWLKARGLDDKSLFDTVRTQILTNRVRAALVEGIRVTDDQVQKYYDTYKEYSKTAEEVRLRMIAVNDKTAGDEILAALQKGAEFDRLARDRITQGGDIGWVNPQTLPPPLPKAVSALKVGGTSGLLQRGAEFVIVRLEERRPARVKSLAEARPGIERRLLAAKQQEVLRAWLTEQEKKSKIEVFL